MNEFNTLAPIVLFVYNRFDHTKRTLEALTANKLAEQSDLIIYSDGAKNSADAELVQHVRTLVQTATGYRSVTVIERDRNFGLANNIIDGVTEACKKYGRVIVLEEDIVTSPYFLAFMNAALNRYKNDDQVWHISGWNYPIAEDGLDEAFFWRVMNCWGWATWIDKWKYFEKNPQQLITAWDNQTIKRFNLNGNHNFWKQVTLNASGKQNTWAIFWYATIFQHQGICLNPTRSLVHNIGHDGSGENCGNTDPFVIPQLAQKTIVLPDELIESALAVDRISVFYRNIHVSFAHRLLLRIKTLAKTGLMVTHKSDLGGFFSRLNLLSIIRSSFKWIMSKL